MVHTAALKGPKLKQAAAATAPDALPASVPNAKPPAKLPDSLNVTFLQASVLPS
ncbi:hypothetical protein D3C76_1572510 [compost metagenome]